MGGRVVEGGSLENYCRATYPGFESQPIRSLFYGNRLVLNGFLLPRGSSRGARHQTALQSTPWGPCGHGVARFFRTTLFWRTTFFRATLFWR